MSKVNTTKFTSDNSESDSEKSGNDERDGNNDANYSNVTLGFADGLINSKSDEADHTVSRIGGKPVSKNS